MSDRSVRFGDEIRAARRAKELTQSAVAAELGVTQPTVSAWESGESYPTPGSLVRLADLLGLDRGEALAAMVADAELAAAAS